MDITRGILAMLTYISGITLGWFLEPTTLTEELEKASGELTSEVEKINEKIKSSVADSELQEQIINYSLDFANLESKFYALQHQYTQLDHYYSNLQLILFGLGIFLMGLLIYYIYLIYKPRSQ